MLDFEQFYLNSKAAVYHYLYQHTADFFEAEDIAQETYALALQEWEMLKEHPNPTGWLILTAKNLCHGYHRHVYYRKEAMDEEREIPYIEPAYNMVVMEDLLENVYTAKEAEVAKKFFLNGDSISELAKELGVSEGCFRTRLYRMRKRLKLYIESCGEL